MAFALTIQRVARLPTLTDWAIVTLAIDQPRAMTRFEISGLSCAVFIAAIGSLAWLGRDLSLAIYTLSFCHYYLYWLAYRFGAVPLPIFKRDAILMKTVVLALLGYVYFQVLINLASLTVVILGFLLNILAAEALGSDRTYYGYEVANLPWRQVAGFPYSWISHPMLVGNIAAYGGTLINAGFRRQWWPLACIHVGMNLALLGMELVIAPRQLNARRAQKSNQCRNLVQSRARPMRRLVACALVAVALGAVTTSRTSVLLGAASSACICAYLVSLYGCYTVPRAAAVKVAGIQPEDIG